MHANRYQRVLAFSTMSQIGFMMFSLGVSKYGGESGLGYPGSIFHLLPTIFKSLLFLGAGAVIHFAHSNDIRDLGGLRKLMPGNTREFSRIACLAIAGIPHFQDSLQGGYSNGGLPFEQINSMRLLC
jgi:NADH-quinone oxidoreductase subunit L